jgi:peptide/nickel transport system substrate-binding protein/oligopeptide transport system substrate-binding protein
MLRPGRIGRLLAIAAVVTLVAVMAGLGHTRASTTRSQAHAPSGVLRWYGNAGSADWVATLDPALVSDSISIYAIDMVNANLVKLDYPSLKVIPDLASRWTVTPNHQVYTFFIRKNARFSNGDDVTAADVKWSITRSLLPATKSPVALTYLPRIVGAAAVAAGKTKNLSGVRVIARKVVQIFLDKPIAYFLGTLSYPTADVLDPKVVAGKASGGYLLNTCSANQGAGQFKFVCLNNSTGKSSFYPSGHSPYMDWVANPYYYGRKPTIRVHAPFYADTEANWRAYQGGDVDVTGVPTADLSTARKLRGFAEAPLLDTDYITPNQSEQPFNNVHCRLAVAYAIDRVGITTQLLHGTEIPAYDIVPKGLLGYFGRESDVPYYNPLRAKQELSQCPGGIKNVTMTYQNTSADLTHEYDAIRANLAAIGADVTMKPLTFNAWLKVVAQNMNVTKTQEQITENLWIQDYPDPQDWLEQLLVTGENYDIGNYSNPTYDKLVFEGNVQLNPAARAQLYHKAQVIALQDGAWIAVGQQIAPYVINPRVHGLLATGNSVQPLGNDWANVTVH